MGTLQENAISLDSDEPLEVESTICGKRKMTTPIKKANTFYPKCLGTYCPVSQDKVFPYITATGREGVWCLMRFEYCVPHQDIVKQIEGDMCTLQPESEGFILIELQLGLHTAPSAHINTIIIHPIFYFSGGTTYIKANVDRTELCIKDLTFHVKGS